MGASLKQILRDQQEELKQREEDAKRGIFPVQPIHRAPLTGKQLLAQLRQDLGSDSDSDNSSDEEPLRHTGNKTIYSGVKRRKTFKPPIKVESEDGNSNQSGSDCDTDLGDKSDGKDGEGALEGDRSSDNHIKESSVSSSLINDSNSTMSRSSSSPEKTTPYSSPSDSPSTWVDAPRWSEMWQIFSNLESKQIYHIVAPTSLDMSMIPPEAIQDIRQGRSVFFADDQEWGVVIEECKKHTHTQVLTLEDNNRYRASEQPVDGTAYFHLILDSKESLAAPFSEGSRSDPPDLKRQRLATSPSDKPKPNTTSPTNVPLAPSVSEEPEVHSPGSKKSSTSQESIAATNPEQGEEERLRKMRRLKKNAELLHKDKRKPYMNI